MKLFISKAQKELDGIILRLEMNMSNNYKDAAISDYNELESKYNEFISIGTLKEKAISKYASILDGYKEKPTFRDDWIRPDSNPESLLEYALSDMISEKA